MDDERLVFTHGNKIQEVVERLGRGNPETQHTKCRFIQQ